MRFERLILENVGGFETLDLALHPKLNVLIGGNGAGKTTTLGTLRASLILHLVPDAEPDPASTARMTRYGATESMVEARLVDGGQQRVVKLLADTDGTCQLHRSQLGRADAVWLYLAPNRFFPSANDGPVGLADLMGDVELYRFTAFVDWFRDAENRENEIRLSSDDRGAYRSPDLQAVRRALNMTVQGVAGGVYDRIRFTRVGPHVPPGGVLVVDKGSATLRISQLSEGESTMLLMTGDIAHRLAQANPDADDPLQGKGIVLIDAVELHLHPSWQRAILPALTRTFPNVQFIVTTHSPQVIGEVPRESVICLRDFQVVPTPPTYGRDSNSILEEVMGASSRDSDVKRSLADIAALIDADDFAAARAKIGELEALLGPDDPDLAGSRAAIAFLDEP